MKKRLFWGLVLLFLPGIIFAQSYALGDVNHSGGIDIVDALMVAQYYVGLAPSGFYVEQADADGGDSIDIVDALLIAQFYVGLIDQLPGQAQAAYTLTLSVTGSGSTSPAAGVHSYTTGESVTVSALPASGSVFTGWSGTLSSTANPVTILMDGDKALVANFTTGSQPTVPPSEMIGFATQNGGTTGGAGGPTVTVTTAEEFEDYVGSHDPYIVQVQGTIDLETSVATVRENKTIIGLGTNATIIGGLKISHYDNLIVRNLTIRDSNNDGITIQDCRNVWVDHCTFIDSSDGQVDIVHAADWVTVSWCRFYYTYDHDHNFVNLIGHDDDNGAEDAGTLHVTFHHNWWGAYCIERMPSVRYGRVHIFNNYFNATGNHYCVRTRIDAEVLVQNNYFDDVTNPWERYVTEAGGTPGKCAASGNVEAGVTWYVNPEPDDDDNQSFLIPGDDTVFSPPYGYSLDAAAAIKNLVMSGAGPR